MKCFSCGKRMIYANERCDCKSKTWSWEEEHRENTRPGEYGYVRKRTPATEKQVLLLKKLGVVVPVDLSKGLAMKMISYYLDRNNR